MKVMFFITFLLLYNIKGEKIEIDCPVGCECDLVENFKRATCVNRNFASLHINMNPIVDILDVSYNQISTLEASVFQVSGVCGYFLIFIFHKLIAVVTFNQFKIFQHIPQ